MVGFDLILQSIGTLSPERLNGFTRWSRDVNLHFLPPRPWMFLVSCQTDAAHTQPQANVVSELFSYFCDFHWKGSVIARMLMM